MQKRAPTRRVSYNPVITLLEMDGNGRWSSQDGNGPHCWLEFLSPKGTAASTAEDSRGRICCEFCKGWHNAHCFQDRGPTVGVELSNWCQLTVVQVANQSTQVNTNLAWLRFSSHGGLPKGLWMSSIRANAPALINRSQESKRKTTVLVIVLAELCS